MSIKPIKPALEKLGYPSDEIERIVAHIDAFDTIEDVVDSNGTKISSGLKSEHLPMFDCAFKPFKGERSLHYLAHLKMMAAAQPFLSGAISKTVNLPESASVDDIMNTYIEGVATRPEIGRNLSGRLKASAPLNTRKTKDMGATVAGIVDAGLVVETLQKRILELEEELTMLRGQVDQPVRHRMPDTRTSLTHKFEIAGHEGYITVGLYEDGQPGELFITMSKEGSTIGGLMDTVGTLTSIALQYGVPLEEFGEKIRVSAVRTERVHKKSGHSPCNEHHRLRVPLARVSVHQGLQGSNCAEPRATRSTAQGNSRHREEGAQPPGHRSRSHRRQGSDRRHHGSSVQWKRRDIRRRKR